MQHSTAETVRRMERVRYVTRNYERLRGFRFAPFAVLLVATGVANAAFFGRPESFLDAQWGRAGFYLVCLAAAFYASERINAYYERSFGRVRQRRRRAAGHGPLLLVAAFAAAVVIGLPSVSERLGTGVLGAVCGAFMAGYLLYNWWPMRSPLTGHWPVLALLALACGMLPSVGVFASWDGLSLIMVPLGGVLAVGFALDHLLVVRTFGKVPEERDAE